MRIRKMETVIKQKDQQVRRLSEALQLKDSEYQRMHSTAVSERHRCEVLLGEIDSMKGKLKDTERELNNKEEINDDQQHQIRLMQGNIAEGEVIHHRLQQSQFALSTLQSDLEQARREISLERQSNQLLQDHIERQEHQNEIINERLRTISRTTGQFQDVPVGPPPLPIAALTHAGIPTGLPPAAIVPPALPPNLTPGYGDPNAQYQQPLAPQAPDTAMYPPMHTPHIQEMGNSFLTSLQQEVTSEFVKYREQTRQAAAEALQKLDHASKMNSPPANDIPPAAQPPTRITNNGGPMMGGEAGAPPADPLQTLSHFST